MFVNMNTIICLKVFQLCFAYLNLINSYKNMQIRYRRRKLYILLNLINFQMKLIKNIEEIEEQKSKYKKRFWKKPQNYGFWEETVPKMTEDLFIEHFRVDRETFNYILDKVKIKIKTKDTSFHLAIPVDKKLAIALKVLATNCEYLSVAALFGVGKTTVHTCFKSFIKISIEELVPIHIKFPKYEEFEVIAQEFKDKWDYELAIGAIDGSHFPCKVPKDQACDYYNFKGWHSVIALAICDANYKVYYVKAGLPGRSNDAGIFSKTWVFKMAEEGKLFPNTTKDINGVKVGYHFLGDGAFALKSWLMKPYPATISEEEKYFNYRLSRARRVIENVFGRVKGRWRRLLNNLDVKIEDVGDVITVAFALHNICESRRVNFNPSWSQAQIFNSQQPTNSLRDNNLNNNCAKSIRDSLKFFYSN